MMNTSQIEQAIFQAISKYVDLSGTYVFLFGSRAEGTAKRVSDYDVGLYAGEKIPFGTIAKIEGELEDLPIPVGIDFVDFALVRPEFKRLALRKIKIWNHPKKNLKLI